MNSQFGSKRNNNQKTFYPASKYRQNEAFGKNRLQRYSTDPMQAEFAPPIVHEVLRSTGKPLDLETQAMMDARFKHDFSRVRVHTDEHAAASAQAVQALAYTVGEHVVFDHGRYAPQTDSGRQLLAHELVHVVQQSQDGKATRTTNEPNLDTEANRVAAVFASTNNHQVVVTSRTQQSLQRQQTQPQYQQVPGITTPQPMNVRINLSGTTTQTINGLEVIFQPDLQSTAQNMRNKARTDFNFDRYNINYRARRGVISSFTGPGQPRVHIRTTYGPGVTSTSRSKYGRGTTQIDVTAGHTSLGFHEGRHGLDYLTYFQQNPYPQFTGKIGMRVADFRAAMQSYSKAYQQYIQNLRRFSERRTDCVGTTIDKYNAQQGIISSLCRVAP